MGQDHELGRRRLKDAADFVRTYRFDLSNYVLVGVSGANLYGPRGQAVFTTDDIDLFCRSSDNLAPAEHAAHLVDDVFPVVPVRQWVLSLPHRLRYVLAWDHVLCRAVSGVFVLASGTLVVGRPSHARKPAARRVRSGRGSPGVRRPSA